MKDLWSEISVIFPIFNNSLDIIPLHKDSFEEIIRKIDILDINQELYNSIYSTIESYLIQNTVPNFWKFFKDETIEPNDGFNNFQNAVQELYAECGHFNTIMDRVEIFKNLSKKRLDKTHKNDKLAFYDLLKSALLSQLPTKFDNIVYAFYNTSFRVFANRYSNNCTKGDINGTDCKGCDQEKESCRCEELLKAFVTTNMYLCEIFLLDRLAGHTLTCLIQESIMQYVERTCHKCFDVSHLVPLNKWLDTVVLNWLRKIYSRNSSQHVDTISELMDEFKTKLIYYLYETYAYKLIDQSFDIVIDYPESQPVLDDLKICLEKLDLRSHLVKTLKTAFETRLLHPGVDTPEILTGYIAAIKAIRHLDSTGVLLETTTEPVKEYLRSRSDTVRCVVTGLTEEGLTDLADELVKSEGMKEDDLSNANDASNNWQKWKPDPIDANPIKASKTNRSSDIISMVIDIYGSKELFVNEYRSLLAERLLTQLDFNAKKEIRNLELIKLRFGESLLHSCEVMLKDISDSKRINMHIESSASNSKKKHCNISALIVSSQFWPSFKKESLELPDEVKKYFESYTKAYEAYKGNRTLSWKPLNGKVNIEIHLSKKTLDMWVTPIQATIIIHFQNQHEWNIEQLSQKMNVPPTMLRKRISFWMSQGLIRKPKEDVYALVDDDTEDNEEMQTQSHDICEDEETESAMASASDQREEELQVFWSYIVGMLTNLDSLSLERIHQMLKMFASQGSGADFSQDELKNFLQRKVREYKLVLSAGVYHLPK